MLANKVCDSLTRNVAEARKLDRIYDMLIDQEGGSPQSSYYLVQHLENDSVELPKELKEVLLQAVSAMRQGCSVTVLPTSKLLTTQQAADFLGMSRPKLINLLDDGQIPYTRCGSHRRIALSDVLEFGEQQRQKQYAAIDVLAAHADEGVDIEHTLGELREARRAVAQKRRTQNSA